MNRKTTTLLMIIIIMAVFSLLTCDILKRPMNLILPSALYAGDSSHNKGDGVVSIYDYEDTELIVELEVLDGGDKYLSVPGFVKIPENELSVTFTCESFSADLGSGASVDVTVQATALHYRDEVEDTVTIYNTEE